MAAILCRICFVEPCKLMAKCLEGCCQCFGSCCECFGKCIGACCGAFTRCCDSISSMCDKPFSGCLFTTVLINLVALIYGIIAILGGGDQCDGPLLILGIVLLIGTIINIAFSYYMYHSINHDTNNKVFKDEDYNDNNQELSSGQKAKQLFCEDAKMAVYIIFAGIFIGISVYAMAAASGCSSNIASGVFAVGLITLIYFGVALLIILSYIAFEVFKEWAGRCECWLVPCCWPCLCIGCCLNWSDNQQSLLDDKNNNNQSNDGRSNNYVVPPEQNQTVVQQQPMVTQQPVVVVQQPMAIQQQQYPPQQQQPQPVMYVQQQPMVAQPTYQQPQQQQPAYNPQAAPIQPGVLVVNQQPPSTNTMPQTQQQQQQQGVAEDNGDEKNEIDYDELKQKGKEAAVAAGKQAKKAGVAALGWMAKKMNDLNDKVQEKEQGKEAAEGQEGGNGHQKTY